MQLEFTADQEELRDSVRAILAKECPPAYVRELGATFEPTALWARPLESDEDERVVVAVALGGVVDDALNDYGIAAGASEIDAAARSTLDALNRRLAQVL